MGLVKRTYTDNVTVITAENLNDIQDEIILQGQKQAEDEDTLALKADKSTTYTKTEVDSALSGIIDPTLSIAGKAADAKATGDRINQVESAFDYVQETQITKDSDFLIYVGNYYQGSNGNITANNNYKLYKFVAVNDFQFWLPNDVSTMDCIIACYTAEPIGVSTFRSPRYRTDNGTQPTEDSKVSISKGMVFTISTYSNKPFTVLTSGINTGVRYLSDAVLFTEERITEIGNEINPAISVDVDSVNKIYTFSVNGYEIPFKKVENAETRSDLWNLAGVSKNGTAIFGAGTDIIGVLQEVGQSDFMGGVHGDETNIEMLILGDSAPLTDSGIYKRIDIFMYSHLTRVSTGDNIIDRVVHIAIEDNEIIIDNTFICLVDNFNLSYAYNGGMWSWDRSVASKIYTSYGIFDAATATGDYGLSKDLSKVSVILNDGSHFEIENIVGNSYEKFEGEIYTYPTGKQKIYYATDHNSTWNTGHRCYGRTVYRLIH